MKLIILGAGGYGRTIKDIAEQSGKYSEIIILDDSMGEGVSGALDDFTEYIGDDSGFYPAFGNNEFRCSWLNRLEEAGAKVATIIHESAYISPTVSIGKGVAILPRAIVNTGVTVGDACIVNIGAIVDHDTALETGVHVAPGAIVKGGNNIPSFTKVESGTVVETSVSVKEKV